MSITGDPLRVGITGLLTSQTALGVVSHNVSNVNTDGYSRQRTDILNNSPDYSGSGYIGTGVHVDNIRRMANQYVNNQVVVHTTAKNYLQTTYDYSSQLDSILADQQAGLNPALQSFFDANQQVASNPVDLPSRNVLLSNAATMAQRFQTLNSRMSDLRSNVNLELKDSITTVNNLAGQIAQLNKDISTAPGRAAGILPNDLIDQRDKLIKEMGTYVKIQTVEQSNGSMNVYVGNGQTMVSDFNSFTMSVLSNKYDSSELGVGYDIGAGQTVDISSLITGGKMQALLDFRDNVITPNQNALGRIAMSLTETYNAQHKLGMDLNSNLGNDFFGYSVEQPLPDVNNTAGAPNVSISITNYDQLTTSDYKLTVNAGGTYDLTRLSDNSVIFAGAVAGGPAIPTTDGFDVTIPAGVVVPGDSYLIRPTRAGARTFNTLITDPKAIAAASPLSVNASLNNIGTGTIQVASVTATIDDPTTPQLEGQGFVTARGGTPVLDPPVRVVFDPTIPNQFTLINDSTLAPIGGPYAYTPGMDIAPLVEAALLPPGDTLGYSVTLDGQPSLNDTFSINYNVQGTSSNTNMVDLAKLQTSNTMINSATNYQDAYGQIVSTVGSDTHQTDIANQAEDVLLKNAESRREAISGVNLDEEASNMLKFQQAYQAAAQVISTANSMFQSLLQSVR